MIHKWKCILTNWINCYPDTDKEECITTDTLLTVISHLHKNLSLDESTSSILVAQNIEEFIFEKYPEFKFENGTVEPANEEEVYVVASLLLFFVCLNSKEVDIKQAMCSKLSQEDQETIMKFSKCLMECSPVTYKDVQAAITESCGQELAASSKLVTETPPALRSLHGDVRRLQAALDAERFDRAFLQDELARTQARMDKLLKDKEQHKLEIMALKAKISMCCGQEADARDAGAASEGSSRLARQLEDLEERLVVTQEQLADAQFERDGLKTKMEELKHERDKWLNVSQQETSRVSQLMDELDTERRRVVSLQDLVLELRQHHQNNGLDASQLECDDPDVSVHSLHNASVCSEACANVIEVQLGEERAKVANLKQQIQNMQDQLNDLCHKTENEKLSLESVIAQKDNDIFNLKHRINEEIEEKNNIKQHFDNEITKLNNQINELEQKLTETTESSRTTIEQKMKEIETLQEEKLSLLQSLSDETTKLETVIKNLKTDIDTEKNLKVKMKEDYDNQLMKLNEKVLNRNNELVELQNKVFEKGEIIEQLNFNLKKEKEQNSELSNKYNNDVARLNGERNVVEHNLHKKTEEAKELQRRLFQNVAVFAELNKDIDDLKAANTELEKTLRMMEEEKEALYAEIQQRDSDLEGIRKEIENITNIFSEEKDKFVRNVEERNATISVLETRLRDESQYKIALENELQHLHQSKALLAEEATKLNKEISKYKAEIQEKDRMVYALDLYLKEEKHTSKNLKADNEKLNNEVKKLAEEVEGKTGEIKELEGKLDSYTEQICQKEEALDIATKQYETVMQEKEALQASFEKVNEEKDILNSDLMERCNELAKMQEDYDRMCQVTDENIAVIESLGNKIDSETKKYIQLEFEFDTQTSNLMAKLNETEKNIKDISTKSRQTIEDKELKLQTLKIEVANLNNIIENERENNLVLTREKEILIEKLNEEISYKNEIQKEYQNQCTALDRQGAEFSSEMLSKSAEINSLKTEIDSLIKIVSEKSDELKVWEMKVAHEQHTARDLTYQKNQDIKELKNKVEALSSYNDELEQELKKEIDSKTQAINALQHENEQLHFTIEEDNSNHEVMIKEKDLMIERLEEHLKVMTVQLESIRKEHESSTLMWEKQKLELREEIAAKDNEIAKLRNEIAGLKGELEQNKIISERTQNELSRDLDKIIKDYKNNDSKVSEKITEYIREITGLKSQIADLEVANESLKSQLEFETAANKALADKEAQLVNENEGLLEEIRREQSKSAQLISENLTFTQEKVNLAKELLEEKALKNLLEEKYNATLAEKDSLQQQLEEAVSAQHILLEEKECLTQQLVEERSVISLTEQEKLVLEDVKKTLQQKVDNLERDIVTLQDVKQTLEHKLLVELEVKKNLEKERECLLKENKDILEKNNQLDQQIFEEITDKNLLKDQVDELNSVLAEERSLKDKICIEKSNLSDQNDVLRRDVLELSTIQDVLRHDKEILSVEKEKLVQCLSEEKAARDELESEKNATSITLHELNEKYACDIRDKEDQLLNVSTELKQMRTDFKKHEDISVNLTSILNNGLDKLLLNIKKEDVGNEVLQKLITIDKEEQLPLSEKCDLLVNIADTLSTELSLRRNLEKALEHESSALKQMKDMIQDKEMQALELQTEVKRLQQAAYENQVELSKLNESYNTTLDNKIKDIQTLKHENKALNNELNDVKVQLEVKVHSLKEKLIDNENLTEKLKRTYECQIENLNVMITKLTSYLKEKTTDLETIRKEKDKLQQVIDENNKVIKSLEEEVKTQKVSQEKLIVDFESERQVIKNMVTVTESIMEDQKVSLNKVIDDHEKAIQALQEEKKTVEDTMETSRKKTEELLQEKQTAFDLIFKELTELRKDKEMLEKEYASKKESLMKEISILKEELIRKTSTLELLEVQNKGLKKEKDQFETDVEVEREKLRKEIESLREEVKEKIAVTKELETRNGELVAVVNKCKDELLCLQEKDSEMKIKKDSLESELLNRIEKLTKVLSDDTSKNDKFKFTLQEKMQSKSAIQEKVRVLTDEIIDLVKEKNLYISKLDEVKADCESYELRAKDEIMKLKEDNARLTATIEENKVVITNLEQLIKRELEQNQKLREDINHDKLNLENRCSVLQEQQMKSEKMLHEKEKELALLKEDKVDVKWKDAIEDLKEELSKKDRVIAQIAKDKDEVIDTLNKELMNEKLSREKYQRELEVKAVTVFELRQKLEEVKSEAEVLDALRRENDEMMRIVGQRETFTAASHERASSQKQSHSEREVRDRHQVSTPTSDLTHSSIESLKTITDLEKIIHDKNRTITTLQSDITYLKSLMADSENKLLDVTKELELTKENCEQLSSQLKKIVHQKNEEIADLKKQVNKMSVTENRATQIIKVSAKYQAIILKRIAEIKSNTILKELTNFGNTANCESDLKRNLNSGAITLEDLENFLETTDRHLRRCTEKQIALQKERDRLTEVNRINESEIINMKKFLTEVSVSFKTFSSIKDLYTQKLSRVVSVQRTVRREILSLDGQITDSMMCKLERGYAAVLQDLAECVMNLERWVERSISRTISAEKIKQAFTSDAERQSLATTSFQNASLEVQIEELEKSFQKLLEEVVRAQKGDGAKDPQALTVMEVRAEYEDKLNRMKAKMKQLYQEQIQVFKEKQKEEIATLERELHKTRQKLAESSRAYEEHIKSLTTELWSVGEKFLMKKDEAEWLRKKRSGSLMSLQHVHSAGLVSHQEVPSSRPSDACSLRSLPVHSENHRERRDGRGLQMSDEEGEVFDNRWLKELATPRRESIAVGLRDGPREGREGPARISELRWRNSLCPPHLKSSYPAETQFANTLDEDDIKCATASLGGRGQRKEVGITAYKKPGPPTPSKQAGRLSATDSELRESLRVEAEPSAARKTSTPSRLRALFRPARHDTLDTPRRKLSNIFKKK